MAALGSRSPPTSGAPGRGLLVAFEGIDGSGKSSALAAVGAALRAEGVAAVLTREETEGPSGGWVRESIRSGFDPLATAFLFAADRAQHVRAMQAEQAAGRHVLCDRYLLSSLAYQGVTLRGRLPDPVAFLRSLHAGWAPDPDLTLLFDVDADAALHRAQGRGATAPYEKAAFLREVRQAYLALAHGDPRVVVLDASRPAAEVAQAALSALRPRLASPTARGSGP